MTLWIIPVLVEITILTTDSGIIYYIILKLLLSLTFLFIFNYSSYLKRLKIIIYFVMICFITK
jgi:hypothetical protein